MRTRALLTLLALTTGALAHPATATARVALDGTRPAYATVALGPVAPDKPIQVQLVLPLRDETGLRALVARVSDPASPDYGHYVTPSEFHARYSPSASSARVVADWKVLKPFEAYDSNVPGPGYDTLTGRGAPSTSFVSLLAH